MIIIDLIEEFRQVIQKLNLLPSVLTLLERVRVVGMPVILVNDAHLRKIDAIELTLFWGEHALRGTEGTRPLIVKYKLV